MTNEIQEIIECKTDDCINLVRYLKTTRSERLYRDKLDSYLEALEDTGHITNVERPAVLNKFNDHVRDYIATCKEE